MRTEIASFTSSSCGFLKLNQSSLQVSLQNRFEDTAEDSAFSRHSGFALYFSQVSLFSCSEWKQQMTSAKNDTLIRVFYAKREAYGSKLRMGVALATFRLSHSTAGDKILTLLNKRIA